MLHTLFCLYKHQIGLGFPDRTILTVDGRFSRILKFSCCLPLETGYLRKVC